MSLPWLYLLPFIPLVFFLHKWLYMKPSMKKLPPSPPKIPILGNLHQLGIHPHRSLRSLSKQYGDLILIHTGSRPTLVVSSAAAAQEIMKTHDLVFSDRPQTKTGNKLLYDYKDVAAAPYGEYWRQVKSICVLQLLSNKRVRSFHGVRDEEMSLMVEKIRRKSGTPVNLSEVLMVFTNDVICRVAFGKKYSGKDDGDGTDFKRLLGKFLELLGGFTVGDFIPWMAWMNKITGWDTRVDRVAEELDQFLERIVEEHMDRANGQRDDEEEDEKSDKVKDLVDVLLEVQKDNMAGVEIDRDSIKAIILDMFSAGTDTTYTVLEWAMAELLSHPKIMQKLQEEVRGTARDKVYVNEEDLENMKYLKAVIKETLRLHPPIPLLVPRRSTQDVDVNGYYIPARTSVVINAWAIQTDPASWEEPERFKPERFLDSSVDYKGQHFQLIPFGAGRRGCPGILFAIANNELALANLMHNFDWSLPGGAKAETLDMDECTGLTIHRKNPLIAVATAHCSKYNIL